MPVMTRRGYVLAGVCLVGLVLSGCFSREEENAPPAGKKEFHLKKPLDQSFEIQFQADKHKVFRGETITFQINIKNTNSEPIYLQTGSITAENVFSGRILYPKCLEPVGGLNKESQWNSGFVECGVNGRASYELVAPGQ